MREPFVFTHFFMLLTLRKKSHGWISFINVFLGLKNGAFTKGDGHVTIIGN